MRERSRANKKGRQGCTSESTHDDGFKLCESVAARRGNARENSYAGNVLMDYPITIFVIAQEKIF